VNPPPPIQVGRDFENVPSQAGIQPCLNRHFSERTPFLKPNRFDILGTLSNILRIARGFWTQEDVP
jgi:hypothetical protein